jgi:hypothetical protein
VKKDKVVVPGDAPTWMQRLQPDFNRAFDSVFAAIQALTDQIAGLGSLFLTKANNLSDITNAGTARTNLGLGSAAVEPADDFVRNDVAQTLTAAQQIVAKANINARRWEYPVQAYGAAGNATADTAAFNAAAAAAAAAGGGVVTGLRMTYVINQLDLITTAGVRFEFPGATINCAQISATGGYIRYSGAGVASTTISSNAAVGDKTLVLTSVGSLAQGSWIQVTRQILDANSNIALHDYISRVESVAGSSVGLETRIPFFLLTSNTHSINTFTPLQGAGVTGLIFEGSTITNASLGVRHPRAVEAINCWGGEWDGIKVQNFPWLSVDLQANVGDRVGTVELVQCGSSSEPDFRFTSCTHSTANKVHSRLPYSGPHVTHGAWNRIKELIQEDAQGRGLKMGSDYNTRLDYVKTQGAQATGIALSSMTTNLSIGRLEASYNGAAGIAGADRSGIWTDDSGNTGSVDSAWFEGNHSYDVALSPNDKLRIHNVSKIDITKLAGDHSAIEGVWRTYTPTVTATGGALGAYTINSARWICLGRRIEVSLDVTVTNLGGRAASDFLLVTLPTTNANTTAQGNATGRELGVVGFALIGQLASATQMYVMAPAGTNTLGVNYRYVAQLFYEEDLTD